MQRFLQDGLEWLEFNLLADIPHLKHAVFLRHGGYSQGPFCSLNTSYDVGDEISHVNANLALIQMHLQQNIPIALKLIWAKQQHGKHINHIHRNSPHETLDCDALVTTDPGLVLMIKHADCQAAIFYDPTHHAVANIHAGWRGSVLNIYAEAIRYMQNSFGSRPEDLLVCISPSLGPDDAEFIHYSQEFPEEFWGFQAKPNYFDFWAISEYQLQLAGILPHHIEIARMSTYSNLQDYFSYRHDHIAGRHGTCVLLT